MTIDEDREHKSRAWGDILTHEDRLRWIADLARVTAFDAANRAHLDRLRLIYAPFPVVQYVGYSYPWAGTIVVDTFFDERKWRPVGKHGAGNGLRDEIDTIAEYDGLYAMAVERALS